MLGNADMGYINLHGSGPEPPKPKRKSGFLDGMLFWWGVVFPLVALVLESTTHYCARQFFDPLPTNWHALLFALIPLSNFLAWMSLRLDMTPHYAFMLFSNGMAVGVAILYTLMFLPITHISILGVLIFGIGLLGLAPLLSLIALVSSGKFLAKSCEGRTYFNGHHVEHLGHLLVLTLIVAVETPSTFTRIALGMAAKPETHQQGLDLLRAFGNQEVMLRACYERSGRATDIVGSLYEAHEPLPIEKARELFYRVTGRTFNSFPIPESARATMRHAGFLLDDGIKGEVNDEFDLDPDIAGEMVSGVSRGLSVCKSDMTGSVDADAAIAKFDWYLNFNNKSKFNREVRTRIKLPHGGVINKASLIVNGREYEANIVVRSLAREVYQAAVARKKNPLLVSTAGTDVVLVQAFPVPPVNMREVQLHLGVVAPLQIDKDKQGVVVLPQFEERNFQISSPHNVSIVSNSAMRADFRDLKVSRDANGKYNLVGSLSPSKLASGGGIIHAERQADNIAFYAPDKMVNGQICLERIQQRKVCAPSHLTVVLDGSVTMGQYIDQIAEAFSALPSETELEVRVVRDGRNQRLPGDRSSIIRSLKSLPCAGGQVNDGEVAEALYEQLSTTDGAVLWIHGAQPVTSGVSIDNILKSVPGERTLLYDMQVVSGPNPSLDGMESIASLAVVPHVGNPADDLRLLFSQWGDKKATAITRELIAPHLVPVNSPAAGHDLHQVGELQYCSFGNPNMSLQAATPPDGAKPCPPEMAQLAAYDQILQDMRRGDNYSKQHAIDLAARYHIVTPMSSAVLVMEIPELDGIEYQEEEPKDITHKLAGLWPPFRLHGQQMTQRKQSFDEIVAQLNRLNVATPADRDRSMPQSAPCEESPACAGSAREKAYDVPSSLSFKKQAAGDGNSYGMGVAGFSGKLDQAKGEAANKELAPNFSHDRRDSSHMTSGAGDCFNSESDTGAQLQSVQANETGAQVNETETVAPLVPESDTYLLLTAALGILGAVLLRNRRLVKKA